MDMIDAIGRRRRSSQNRGLRSLFPKLPGEYQSRVVRLAMRSVAWAQIQYLASRSSAPTLPRAYGEVVEELLGKFDSPSRVNVSPSTAMLPRSMEEPSEKSREDWQAWQIQKEMALLAASASARWQGDVSHGAQWPTNLMEKNHVT